MPNIDKRLEKIEKNVDHLTKNVDNLSKDMDHLTKNVDNLSKDMDHLTKNVDHLMEVVFFVKDNAVSQDEYRKDMNLIKSQMVTKDYLDTKLADLRGDLVILIRKEDTKVKSLVDLLKKKKIITNTEAAKLFQMEPFAQVM